MNPFVASITFAIALFTALSFVHDPEPQEQPPQITMQCPIKNACDNLAGDHHE